MTHHADALRLQLASGPKSGTQIGKAIGLSQPTVTRALAAMGEEVMKTGQKKSSRYFLRDRNRGFDHVPVFRVDSAGKVKELGELTPVRPDGFVFTPSNGQQIYSQSIPWWLLDMLPQGFLGRAYAARYGAALGLPSALKEWSDSHALRALLVHGHDLVGNLLIGTLARDQFISAPEPDFIREIDKAMAFVTLAANASAGDVPGSSAGGEQPKFTAYVESAGEGRHVIVKFSEAQEGPQSMRWRDLLLAEHLALSTLGDAGIAAAKTSIYDHQAQRFLEVQRFDRVGALGRQALISLRALDAEFVGAANQPWPVIAQSLAKQGVITLQAADDAQVLWAFGALIGNTDMHYGNLSFVSEQGQPYQIAPAYDVTSMCFAPTSSGRLPGTIHPIILHASVSHANWRRAQQLAQTYVSKMALSNQFSAGFQDCMKALRSHLESATLQINRLG